MSLGEVGSGKVLRGSGGMGEQLDLEVRKGRL